MTSNAVLSQRIGLLALALLAAASSVSATSYVMVSDANLADQAAVIAQVKISAVEPAAAGSAPATLYQVDVERLLKGYTAGSTIIVRVPGGMSADGRGLRIWGAPEFHVGEGALLFLQPRPDGSYAILHLMLGAFHAVDAGGREIAIRNLAGADEVKKSPSGEIVAAPGSDVPRDLALFAGWLLDRAQGQERRADYFVTLPANTLDTIRQKFTLLSSDGLDLRWFVFDTGGSVTFLANSAGQQGLAGGGFTEYQNALAAWTNEPTTPVRYVYGGETSSTAGLKRSDNLNTILWNDPNNEVGSPFSCDSGGTLAVSAPWFDPTVTGRFNGVRYLQILEADTITNSGISCFFQDSIAPSKAAEELFGHELGHTLGLGHSCGDAASGGCSDPVKSDSLMRAFIHDDGRGARLGSDDIAGLRRLYLPAAASGPCRANATTLCLQSRRFSVQVDWQNQFDGTSGVGRAVPRTDETGFFSFGDPSNIELLVKILDFGDVIKVFYGELTDLHFTITVTDTRTGSVKTYGNTAGDCGGIDQSAFAASTAGASVALKRTAAASGSCRPGKNTLCLLQGRFAVTVDWANSGNGTSGQGGAGPLSNLVGTFFFTDPANVELMSKVIDFGDRIAFFYGSLSDLPYTIHVTDTLSGATQTYQSTAGLLCGGLDNNAF
ncbi:MAG TPA: hypothetical protein VOA87_16125 [Thermoanaerobaculia bacterium]|nr:hypothetical protein [Thermoanaerobaculia bacterium]